MRLTRLAAALLCGTVAACGGSSGGSYGSMTPTPPTSPTGPVDPTPSTLTIIMPAGATNLSNTAYAPNPATISVGSTVTWVNNDRDFHTASSNTNVFESGNMPPGASFSFTFRQSGSFPYRCLIHPNMIGVVNVQ